MSFLLLKLFPFTPMFKPFFPLYLRDRWALILLWKHLLISCLSSWLYLFAFLQPTLRYLAVSTLRHLVEKDPVIPQVFSNFDDFKTECHFCCISPTYVCSRLAVFFCNFLFQVAVIDEKIEVYLFHMLDEETDPEYVYFFSLLNIIICLLSCLIM